jgi:UDP-glucose 4-epimerase
MIVITGGLGFLGTGLARYLLQQGQEVLLTKHRSSYVPGFLTPYLDRSLHIVGVDLLDMPSLISALKKYPVKSIIHAAVTIPANATLYQVVKINLEGTANVLEAARLMEIERVTFTSSITVYYGRQDNLFYSESMPINIDFNHPIGTEKIAVETLCNLYAHEYGINLFTCRPSMIYGARGFDAAGLMARMVEGAVREGHVVIPQFSPDYSMDFVYMDDCAEAISRVHLAKEPKHRVYNTALGKNYYLREIAPIIEKLVPGSHIELKGTVVPWPKFAVDMNRLRDEFGFEPRYDIEGGVREYVEAFRKQISG